MPEAVRVLPARILVWTVERDKRLEMERRLPGIVREMKETFAGPHWLLLCEEYAAILYHLGSDIMPPDKEIQATFEKRGWLLREYVPETYDDGLPEPTQETETMA